MPNPVSGDLRVDTLLDNLSVAFRQNESSFIADRAFLPVRSRKLSNKFATFDRADWNRDDMQKRASATQSAGSGYRVADDSYFIERYAIHKDIDEVDEQDADEVFDLDREATDFVTLKDLIKREVTWATNFFTAGDPGDTWTFDADGAGAASGGAFDPTDPANNQLLFWSTANSTPIADVAQGKKFVLESTGFEPNVMVIGYEVWEILKNHADILARLTGGATPDSPAIVLQRHIAAMFELEELLIMKAIRNTADEGLAATHSFIAGKNSLLAYRPQTPGRYTPAAGYNFVWTGGNLGLNQNGTRMMRGPVANTTARRIEIESYFEYKKISADLGYFFGGIVE